MNTLIECIPNFSEGRDKFVINAIAASITKVVDVELLNIDSNSEANRSVYTFVGKPEAVFEAAFNAIKTSAKLIDMRLHKGAHPRIGACDVCPLVPLKNININEVSIISKRLAQKVAQELLIPVYSYENDAKNDHRRRLETIREGEYENLEQKMLFPEWTPDFGYPIFNAKSGAIVIGSRELLIAFNINLETKDVSIAKKIATLIRESSNNPSSLKGIKAIGWSISDFNKIQVSTNITNYNNTSIIKLFETVKNIANKLNTKVTGSELIGLVPLDAIMNSASELKSKDNFYSENNKEIIEHLAQYLGLNEVKPFNYLEQIIEYKAKLVNTENCLLCNS
ncbi:MAG: glutamate formimidoyltransferase [Bacteroidales bacterium]|nr:glutamate formimidoyltransferase [Bacteroidales bacterium]